MKMAAKGFLRLVSVEYVALGIFGLVALGSRTGNLLALCGLLIPVLLVTPLPLTVENGIEAGCYGQPRGSWGCNLDDYVIQQARAALMVLCIVSIIGGALGIWGASTRNKEAGGVIWLALTGASVAVAAWNVKWFLFDSYFTNPLMGFGSMFWAVAYATAYYRSFRMKA